MRRGLKTAALAAASFAAAAACSFAIWVRCGEKPPLLEGIAWSEAVYDRTGALLHLSRASDGIYRLRADLNNLRPAVISATLHYEDRRFYDHPGVNFFALVRAAFSSFAGPRPIGASTITMQVVRRVKGLSTRSIPGKISQIAWALRYEAHYSKNEILAAYLSLAPYGGNVEGIEAAARVYFHKSASRLSSAEAVALSAVPQNPVKRRPGPGPDFEKARSRAGQSFIKAGLAPFRIQNTFNAPLRLYSVRDLPFKAPHFTRLVESFPENKGQVIHSSISESLNESLSSLLRSSLSRFGPYGINNGALAVIDTRTMELIAYVGSSDFFNKDIAGEVDGLQAPRSPGSTLKPFIYALALDQGLIHSRSILNDSPKNFSGYSPENADNRFEGPLDATRALITSRNLPAISLAQKLGPDLYDFQKTAGISLPFSREHYGLSLVLGGAEVTPLSLLKLYALLSNQGLLKEPRYSPDGPAGSVMAVISPEAAWITKEMLSETGYSIWSSAGKVPLLWKTGTSNGYRDAWCAGLAGPYAGVVWIGDFDGRPNAYLQGSIVALPIFQAVMQRVISDKNFAPTQEELIELSSRPKGVRKANVCRATGDSDLTPEGEVRCEGTVSAWVIPGRSPIRDTGVLKPIFIDQSTGLRACTPGPQTKKIYWEFWPAEFLAGFDAAGKYKQPPPPWAGKCKRETDDGASPVITSPAANVSYFTGTAGKDKAAVVLKGYIKNGARRLFWFSGAELIGTSAPGEELIWAPSPGTYTITVSDSYGNSASIAVSVRHP